MRCVIKFRSQHRSASHFRCRCGHRNRIGGECRHGCGDERFVGSRRLEGCLLTGVNLRTQGRKLLFYFHNALLQRQLKHSYCQCEWCAHQEQVGQSGWLTLGIKCSNELFHCVNEDGEFGGFSFRGRSCGSVKHKVHGIVDLFQSVWVIGKVIRKFELESVANSAPKLQWEAMVEGKGRQGFYFPTLCHNIFEVPNLGIPLTHCTLFYFWEVGNLSDHPPPSPPPPKVPFFSQWQRIQCLLVLGLLYGYLCWCFCPCLAPKSEFPFESFHLVPMVLGMGMALLSR